MALTNTPFGLSITAYCGGKPRAFTYDFPLAAANTPAVGATPLTSLGTGDPVSLINGHVATPTVLTVGADLTATTQIILGVWQEVKYQPLLGTQPPSSFPYWVQGTSTMTNAAGNGTDAYVSLNIQPGQIYNVMANNALTSASVGKCYNLAGFGGATAANGFKSTVYLDTTTQVSFTTGSFVSHPALMASQVKVLGLAPVTPAFPVNNWTDPYPIVQVILNNSWFKPGAMPNS